MVQDIYKLNDRQYKSLTGLSKKDFQQLAVIFSECEQKAKNEYYEQFVAFYDRKPSAGGSPIFKTPSEKLFFCLFYLKNYPTFDVLGFTFGCSNKTAHENLHKFLPHLKAALNELNVLPKREFESVEEFIEFTKKYKDIIIDVTERLHHRKKNYDEQKKYYNGKKKAQTVKNTIMSTLEQMVLFVGKTFLGATHDYTMLKEEFSTKMDWFKQIIVWIDLGYLGFAKDYIAKKLNIPFKKPRKSKNNPNPQLTDEQKLHNKAVGKGRVKVENAIGA